MRIKRGSVVVNSTVEGVQEMTTTTGAKTRHKKVNLPRCFKIHRSYSVKIRQFPVVLWSCSDGREMYKKA